MKKQGVVFALALGALCCAQAAHADDELEKGKTIYNGTGACFSCHGPTGAGDGAAAAALNPKPRSFVVGKFNFDTDGDGKTGTETDLFNVITNGAQKYGGSMMMVARPDLSEADRKAVIKYVLSLKK
jgi:mono/diheme cytochrome c family protein